MTSSERLPYIALQKRYFDERVEVFCRPIPESIELKTDKIVKLAGVGSDSKVLDVGCGVGVLMKHFIENGVKPKNIVGCDLSEVMISQARQNYPGVYFWQGDIVDLEDPLPDSFPNHLDKFDFVFFNACFGNMFDQKQTLIAAFKHLKTGANVILSHPLGSRFVEALKVSDPEIVPHSLPDRNTLHTWRKEGLHFEIRDFETSKDFYFVSLTKTNS